MKLKGKYSVVGCELLSCGSGQGLEGDVVKMIE
jgi:hypothetical protein